MQWYEKLRHVWPICVTRLLHKAAALVDVAVPFLLQLLDDLPLLLRLLPEPGDLVLQGSFVLLQELHEVLLLLSRLHGFGHVLSTRGKRVHTTQRKEHMVTGCVKSAALIPD